ncbi:MAG: serine protease [Patescibacteria group bacterium]
MQGSNEPISVKEKFSPLKVFGHRIQQIIMPIFAIADGEFVHLGTGFLISPDGLMMTAKHVIDEVFEERLERRTGGGLYKNVELFALYVTNTENPEVQDSVIDGPWPISFASYSDEYDIAYCWLKQALVNDKPFKFSACLSLSPGIPSINENILGFGYYGRDASFTGNVVKGRTEVQYSQETAFTRGVVKDIHFPKRDSFHLKFPCFHTTARFDPGMSGGPIFNESGGVCGVICDAFGESDENGDYISYGSLVWPSLAITLETKIENDPTVTQITAYEMIKRGFIKADKTFDNLHFVRNGKEVSLSLLKPKG